MEALAPATCGWPLPPCNAFDLSGDQVHVWCASVSGSMDDAAALRELLSEDERIHAQRYHFTSDRHRYCVSRGLLRALLAHYTQMQPTALTFSHGPRGKPTLSCQPATGPVYFNISHCSDIVLYAVTRKTSAVGIDVEHVRVLPDLCQIATRFFSQAERKELAGLNQDRQPEGFFNCWTRKEAYIKATGDGLSHGLDNFDVSLTPNTLARILSIRRGEEDASQWLLKDLTPARGYIAALAMRTARLDLHCWQVPLLEQLSG